MHNVFAPPFENSNCTITFITCSTHTCECTYIESGLSFRLSGVSWKVRNHTHTCIQYLSRCANVCMYRVVHDCMCLCVEIEKMHFSVYQCVRALVSVCVFTVLLFFSFSYALWAIVQSDNVDDEVAIYTRPRPRQRQ